MFILCRCDKLNAVVLVSLQYSILNDGRVRLEWLYKVGNGGYSVEGLFEISQNGNDVIVYSAKRNTCGVSFTDNPSVNFSSLCSVYEKRCYNLVSMPKPYYRYYRMATDFVKEVKAKTVKVASEIDGISTVCHKYRI